MAREVLSNGVINPDKYQADWYADLSNNWNLLNNLIGSAISSSEVDSKIATAIQELMIRTFQIVAELPVTGTEGVMYLVSIPDTSKYTAYVWENNAYRELGVIQMTITIDDELSTTSENPLQNKVTTNALNGKANISHTHSASDITSGLATVATSGSYNDLSNKPTIPTVNNATLTIQQNGTNVQTFTANQSTNATANITVPTKTSDLTNDSGFITSDNTKIPLAGSNQISGSLIPATTDAYDLGGSSYQWNNAYIKSLTINGVACGDILTHNVSEFVNVTGVQTVGGQKTFSHAQTGIGRDLYHFATIPYGKNTPPANTSYHYIWFTGNSASQGFTNNWYGGYLEQLINTDGSARGRWMIRNTNENGMGIQLSQNADGSSSTIIPLFSNIDLGTSTCKWKSFNGINPGALSLPSMTFISLDTTNFDATATTIGTFIPTVDGWVILSMTQKNKHFGIWILSNRYRVTFHSVYHNSDYFIFALIPVRANVSMTIYCTADDIDSTRKIDWLRLFPCQGNV